MNVLNVKMDLNYTKKEVTTKIEKFIDFVNFMMIWLSKIYKGQ